MNELTPQSIRALRLRLRLTQAQLAERLSGDPKSETYHEVSPSAVHRWETDENKPNQMNAAKLRELMEKEA